MTVNKKNKGSLLLTLYKAFFLFLSSTVAGMEIICHFFNVLPQINAKKTSKPSNEETYPKVQNANICANVLAELHSIRVNFPLW